MKREKLVIMPRLNDCQGNLSKKWFVFYSARNPRTGLMERFKDYAGLAKKKQTARDRYAIAEEKINSLRTKLLSGWTPFLEEDDPDVLYSDTIQYQNVAAVYGNEKRKNRGFNFFANEYMSSLQGAIRHDTVTTYNSKLRIFGQWLDMKGIGDIDITGITHAILLDFWDWLINQRKLSGNSVRKYKQLLKAVFEFVKLKQIIRVNPVENLPECRRINDCAPRPIHEEDINTFIREVEERMPQLFLVICFEYYCFLRPGCEIRLMKIDWIDWGRGVIVVPANFSKNKKQKMVTMPEPLILILRKYNIHKAKRGLYVLAKGGQPGEQHYGKNYFRYNFAKIRKALDMPHDYKLYSWKHTGNIRALEAGIPQMEIMDQNGHSSLEVTNNYIRNRVRRVSTQIQKAFPSISE